jgi:hypothetical protein
MFQAISGRAMASVPLAQDRASLAWPNAASWLSNVANLGAHHIGAAVEHLGDGDVDLVADPALLRGEVDEGHAHGRRS